MAVEVNNGGLSWKASIDTSQLQKDSKNIQNIFRDLTVQQGKEQQKQAQKLADSYKSIFASAQKSFVGQSAEVQKESFSIQKLGLELKKVGQAQASLNKLYETGKITVNEYTVRSAALSNLQDKINKSIAEANARVRDLAIAYNQSSTAIGTYEAQLSRLTEEYNKLSAAERAGSKGTKNLFSQAAIQNQIQQAERLKKATLENLTVFSQTGQSIDNLSQRVAILTQRYSQLTIAQAKDANVGGKIQEEIRTYQQQIDSVTKYNQALSQNIAIQNMASGSLEQKRARLAILQTQYNQLTEAELKNKQVGGQLAAQIRALDRDISKYGNSLSGVGKQSVLMNQVLATTAGFLSIQQGSRIIGDIIRTRGEIEQLEVAFTTMLRSKQAADDLMKEIVQIATETPFTLTDVASATKQLLAYGFAQKEIKGELLAIGNIASGVGASFGDIAYAYGTLRAQGRAYAYDIRQFTGRGIPVIAELAKVMNVTTQEVQSLVEAGKVGFPEVQKAFQNMTGAGGQFFNLMEKQSQTVTGEIAKLQDRIQLMYNEIGGANDGIIKDAISGLSFLVEHYKDVADIIATLIVAYGSYRAALILTAASQAALGASSFALGRYLVSLRAIITGLNAALVTSPVGAFTLAITALGLAFYSLTKSINTAQSAQDNYLESTNAGAIAAGKEAAKVKDLIAVLNSENASRSQKEAALKSLRSQLGTYVEGLSDEELASDKAKEAIDRYTKSIQDNVAAKKAFEQYSELRDQLVELETKGVEALSRWQRAGEDLRNVFDPSRGKNFTFGGYFRYLIDGDRQDQVILESFKKDIQDQMKSLTDAFDITGELTGTKTTEIGGNTPEEAIKKLLGNVTQYFDTLVSLIGNKADADKIKESLDAVLESLAPNDPQIAKVKSQLIKINKVLETYSLKAENKEAKDMASERKKILDDLNRLEDRAYKKSFDKREQEKADLKRELDELRKLAEEAGLGAGILTRIDNLEIRATGNIDYRNDTEKLKEEFETRKKLYEDYENHVRDFGVTSAEKRYRSELDVAKNYLGQIQDEYTKLVGVSIGRTLSGSTLTGPESERLRDFKIILDAEKREQQSQLDALLKANQSYQQERTTLIENQARERAKIEATGDSKALATFEKNARLALKELNENAAKDMTGFTLFFDNIRLMSRKAAFEGINVLKKAIEELSKKSLEDGGIDPNVAAEWIDQLNQTAFTIGTEIPQEMQKWATAMNSIAQSVSEVNSDLGAMFGTIGDIVGGLANVQLGFNDLQAAQQTEGGADDFTAKANLYATAINSVVKLTGMVINASKQRREIDEKYYKSVIGYQQDYNLALVEQTRIQSEVAGSVFMTDYQGKLEDGYASLTDASKGFNDALKELEKVQVKTGTKSFFDLKTAAGAVGIGAVGGAAIGALAAAAAGAAIGSVVPVIGTIIGAGVGAIVGIFAAKKKKDSYGSLLEQFPELIQTSADGLVTVNKELAEAILANDLIREGGKELVENVLEWGEAVEAARAQITETIGELTGQIGGDLRNALVESFRAGTDAGIVMTETVGKAIENMVSQLLFSAVFADIFKELQDDLVKSLDPISGDQSVIDDFDKFLDKATPAQETFFDLMEQIQKQAAERGIDIFQPDSAGANKPTGLAGAIRRELTEATGSELVGIFRGFYDLAKIGNNIGYEHLAVANSQLSATMAIQTNTANTVNELQLAVYELRIIAKNTKPGQSDRDLGAG